MGQITDFIVAMVTISFVIVILALFLSDISARYNVTDYSSNLSVYDKMDSLTNHTKEIETGLTDVGTESGVVDIVGSLFADAYRVVLITLESFGLFNTMADDATEQASLGVIGPIFNTFIKLLVLIILIFTLISALLQWDV